MPLGSEGLQVADGQQEGMELKFLVLHHPPPSPLGSPLFAPEPLEFFPCRWKAWSPTTHPAIPNPDNGLEELGFEAWDMLYSAPRGVDVTWTRSP